MNPCRTLYVSDLDGTLLRPDSTLSHGSAELLNQAIGAGALFSYATARSFSSSRRVLAEVDLRLPVITYGGTVTADPVTGQPERVTLLNARVVQQLLDLCSFLPDAEPIWFSHQAGRDWVRWDAARHTAGVEAFLNPRQGDARLRPITADDPLDVSSVFYVSTIAPRQVLAPLPAQLPHELATSFLLDDPGTPGLDWFEVHSPEGTKAAAISDLATTVGATRLVVFGNHHNDLPMFEIADLAIAVEDAIPEVRAAASLLIGPSHDDAVASWIAQDHQQQSSGGTTPPV